VDRDLARLDLWDESLVRSRSRREFAVAAKGGFELPARGLSVAALVAVTGGTVASVGLAKVASGGEDSSNGSAAKTAAHTVALARASERSAPAAAGESVGGAAAAAGTVSAAHSSSTGGSSTAQAKIEPSAADSVDGSSGVLVKRPVAAAAASGPATQADGAGDQTGAGADVPGAGAGTGQGSAPGGDGSDVGSDGGSESANGNGSDDSTGHDGGTTSKDAEQPAGGVDELQQAIGVAPDGDFGPRTERALKHWQREHGLTPDGVAGPQTREALDIGDGKVLKRDRPQHKQPSARKRQRSATDDGAPQSGGGGVRALQQALGIGADGVFGPGTEQALKSWQRAHGLTPDGVAGLQTRQALGIGDGKVLKRHGGRRGGSGGGSSDAGSSVVQRVVAAANAIATTPYVYGGGHGSFQSSGYDCSGSVSYALHGGGLLSSPLDSSALESYGDPGPGRHITIYANSGHAYMVIDGRRYDTSARSETGSRWSSTQRSSSGYVVRHPRGL
jgi:peptidoglycan hydrolase-like protein with peptidoglycan-binding domain